MPIYEYQCDSCTHKFEVKQSIKDDPISTCERCGKPVRRLISSPGIMFKGSGWYITDYSEKMKPTKEGDTPAPASTEKKEAPAAATSTASSSSSSPGPASTTSSSPTSSSGSSSTPPSSGTS